MNNLFKFLIIFVFIGLQAANVTAQDSPVQVSYKVNSNKTVDFSFTKPDPGTFTVVLAFTNLTNSYDAEQSTLTAKDYSGNLKTLTPSNKEQGIGFSYKYSYIRGKLNPKYNADFVYLLPFKKGTKVKAVESSFVNATYFGSTTPDDWKVYRFFTQAEDTVTAVRKGLVVSIKDLYETNTNAEVAYTSQTNELMIEHADGTLATYRGFKKGSLAVKLGQTVFPGTPLAVAAKAGASGRSSIALLITYLKSAEFGTADNQSFKTSKSYYGFITPKFCTTENAAVVLVPQQEYTAADSPEIIRKEFTKKELKLAAK
ncbi:hypothetical protein ACFQ3S_11820 [Mucilaginibacter terrae]|uniref:hypothetical protein n=1 Tax=Mucilaginibacter terrae TaxID=1955052 RepID=UPI0036323AF5